MICVYWFFYRNRYKPILGLHFGPLNLDIFSENCTLTPGKHPQPHTNKASTRALRLFQTDILSRSTPFTTFLINQTIWFTCLSMNTQSGVFFLWLFSPMASKRPTLNGGWDKSVRVWNSTTGAPIGLPLKAHSDWMRAVLWSPCGKWLASRGEC